MRRGGKPVLERPYQIMLTLYRETKFNLFIQSQKTPVTFLILTVIDNNRLTETTLLTLMLRFITHV